MHRNTYKTGIILITLSAIAWSTAGLFTRLIEVDTTTMLFWRGLFGALGIALFALLIQGRQAISDYRTMGLAGWSFTIVSALGMLCYITSLRMTTVAHVSIIYATVPLITAVLAWVTIKEKPAKSTLFAAFISFAGVAIIVGLGTEGNFIGNLLAFGMTLSLAIMMIIARQNRDIPIFPAAALSALLSGVVVLPMASQLVVPASELTMLILFGLVNSALGISLFTLGSKMLPASETALIGTLDAPLAPIWVWLIFSETPGLATMMGGTIVFVAIISHVIVQNQMGRKYIQGAS